MLTRGCDQAEERHAPRAARRPNRRSLLRWGAGGAAVLAATRAARRPDPAFADAGQRLEGTWLASFNTVPPTPTPALYRLTFMDGGGMIATYPPLRPQPDGSMRFVTNGAGEWKRTGDREFSFMYLLDLHEIHGQPPQASRIETHTIWGTVTLNDRLDQWLGAWKRENVDLGGTVVGGLDGRVEAQRLSVLQMP